MAADPQEQGPSAVAVEDTTQQTQESQDYLKKLERDRELGEHVLGLGDADPALQAKKPNTKGMTDHRGVVLTNFDLEHPTDERHFGGHGRMV